MWLMRKERVLFFFTIFFLISGYCAGQNLQLSDLLNISKAKTWENINHTLINKNWEFNTSSSDDYFNVDVLVYSFGRKTYSNEASGWLGVYVNEDYSPQKIKLEFYNPDEYTKLLNQIKTSGFKSTSSQIKDDEVILIYENNEFRIEINQEKTVKDESYSKEYFTSYEITILKKKGVFDKFNGDKKEYHYNGNLKLKYTLINGEKNGKYFEYDNSGILIKEYNLKNDKLHGECKESHLNGKISELFNYYLGEQIGNFKRYNYQGNLILEYNLKDGELNGEYITNTYDSTGTVFFYSEKSTYLNDKKNGKTIFKGKSKPGSNKDVEFFITYKDGLKDGEYLFFHGDTIIEGNYQDGIKIGYFTYYRDINSYLFGGIPSKGETNRVVLEGNYRDGIKEGVWKIYNFNGCLTSVQNYKDGLLNGLTEEYSCDSIAPHSVTNEVWLFPKDDPTQKRYILSEGYFENGMLNGRKVGYRIKQYDKDSERLKTPGVVGESYIPYISSGEVNIVSYHKQNKKDGSYFIIHNYEDRPDTIIDGAYLNDKKEGLWVEKNTGFFSTIDSTYYKNGVKHGKSKIIMPIKYVNADKIESQQYFIDKGNYFIGEPDGVWVSTFKDSIMNKVVADEGKVLKYQEFEKNTPNLSINYKNDKLHGDYFFKGPEGKSYNGQFKEGVLNGLITSISGDEKVEYIFEKNIPIRINYRSKDISLFPSNSSKIKIGVYPINNNILNQKSNWSPSGFLKVSKLNETPSYIILRSINKIGINNNAISIEKWKRGGNFNFGEDFVPSFSNKYQLFQKTELTEILSLSYLEINKYFVEYVFNDTLFSFSTNSKLEEMEKVGQREIFKKYNILGEYSILSNYGYKVGQITKDGKTTIGEWKYYDFKNEVFIEFEPKNLNSPFLKAKIYDSNRNIYEGKLSIKTSQGYDEFKVKEGQIVGNYKRFDHNGDLISKIKELY